MVFFRFSSFLPLLHNGLGFLLPEIKINSCSTISTVASPPKIYAAGNTLISICKTVLLLFVFCGMLLQVEYLLKKISTAMSQEWDGKLLEDLMLQDATVREEGMSVWSFLEHMGAGRLLRVTSAEAFTLALDEAFLEMYHNVLKRVRHAFTSPVC